MAEILISVVVPVYNADKYLHSCIETILSQSFTDYELILVDDGSTDKSPEICDEFARNDNRVSTFHTINSGSSAARNFGLSKAKGMYVAFVDSDDWVEKDYLESMFKALEDNDADVVISSYYRNVGKKQITEKNVSHATDKSGWILGFLYNQVHAGLWNKLVKRSLFLENGITFPKSNYYEDMVVSAKLIASASRIVYCNIPTYHYRVINTSQTYDHGSAKRLKLYNDFIINIGIIKNISDVSTISGIEKAFDYQINHNKKKTIKCLSNDEDILKVLKEYPNSIKLSDIRSVSDVFLFLASKFHCFSPFKIYKYL